MKNPSCPSFLPQYLLMYQLNPPLPRGNTWRLYTCEYNRNKRSNWKFDKEFIPARQMCAKTNSMSVQWNGSQQTVLENNFLYFRKDLKAMPPRSSAWRCFDKWRYDGVKTGKCRLCEEVKIFKLNQNSTSPLCRGIYRVSQKNASKIVWIISPLRNMLEG